MPPAVHLPTPDEVHALDGELAGLVRTTPVLDVHADELGAPGPARVTLKLEQLQVTGSFKARGAFAQVLAARAEGTLSEGGPVVAASGGNFGLAAAHAATALGHPAHVFVPSTSPAAKVARLRDLGAEVVVVDGFYAEAAAEAAAFADRHGVPEVHPYDAPAMVAGSAHLGRELEAQVGVPDVLLVAVGGGGLLAGLTAWFGDRCAVVAVETEGTPTLARALDAGGPVDVEVGGLAASSLGARRIGAHAWALRDRLAGAVLVTDDEVADAQSALWRAARLATEPGGATALAGLRAGAGRALLPVDVRDRHVAVVVCGANVSPADVPT